MRIKHPCIDHSSVRFDGPASIKVNYNIGQGLKELDLTSSFSVLPKICGDFSINMDESEESIRYNENSRMVEIEFDEKETRKSIQVSMELFLLEFPSVRSRPIFLIMDMEDCRPI